MLGGLWLSNTKASYLVDAQDAKEKKNVGEVWAEKSDDKGLFLMAEKRNSKGQSLSDQLTVALG